MVEINVCLMTIEMDNACTVKSDNSQTKAVDISVCGSARDGSGGKEKVPVHLRSDKLLGPHYCGQPTSRLMLHRSGTQISDNACNTHDEPVVLHGKCEGARANFDGLVGYDHLVPHGEPFGYNDLVPPEVTRMDEGESVGYGDLVPPDVTRISGVDSVGCIERLAPPDVKNFYTVKERKKNGNFSHFVTNFKKCEIYDGTTNMEDCLSYFEILSKYNNWNPDVKAFELATSLRGPALCVLTELPTAKRRSYTDIVSALTNRFEPNGLEFVHRLQWRKITRRSDQTLPELAQEVRRMTRKAFPNIPPVFRRELEIDCFLNSIDDFQLKWEALRQSPTTLDDCLNICLKFESYLTITNHESCKLKEMNSKTEPVTVNMSSRLCKKSSGDFKDGETEISCFFCRKSSHKQKTCRLYLKFKQNSMK